LNLSSSQYKGAISSKAAATNERKNAKYEAGSYIKGFLLVDVSLSVGELRDRYVE
jgi:hypothetical protein